MEYAIGAARAVDADLLNYLLLLPLLILTAAISGAFSLFIEFALEDHPWGKQYLLMLQTLPQNIAKPLGECVYCCGAWVYLIISFFVIDLPFFLCVIGLGANHLFITYLTRKKLKYLLAIRKHLQNPNT